MQCGGRPKAEILRAAGLFGSNRIGIRIGIGWPGRSEYAEETRNRNRDWKRVDGIRRANVAQSTQRSRKARNELEGKKAVRRSLVAMTVGLLLAAAFAGRNALADDLERGRDLFALCAQCHGEAGTGNELYLAPAIAGLNFWYVEAQLGYFKTGVRGLHPDDIAGMRMAPMSRTLRSDDDVRAVATYVSSLPPVSPAPTLEGGDADKGKTTFALCATCHGADAAGNQQMFAPRLRNGSDWYLFSQIQKFQSGVRGSTAGNPNGAVMRGMAMTLANEQAIKDVLAYIGTLSE